jgi:hypothetical protein
MVAYAIMPRRRSYWIEAIHENGERRPVGCFPNEDAAVRRLHELQGAQEAQERRRIAQEASRWHVLQTVAPGFSDLDSSR